MPSAALKLTLRVVDRLYVEIKAPLNFEVVSPNQKSVARIVHFAY